MMEGLNRKEALLLLIQMYRNGEVQLSEEFYEELLVETGMPLVSDSYALDLMKDLMDGVEWTPDTLDAIATTLRLTKREVRDMDEPKNQYLVNVTIEFESFDSQGVSVYEPVDFECVGTFEIADNARMRYDTLLKYARGLRKDELKFEMTYKHCDSNWVLRWSSACDDECPECGAEITPTHVRDL